MKTSIFNMNFVLPPMVEMVEVEKGMPTGTGTFTNNCSFGLLSPCPVNDDY